MVVRDPASLEVVRRRKKAKTDRTGARRMVRALRAWDCGDRDAMSPVRIPTVAEEEGRRLLRRRERLVRERRRLANAVDGLLRLHGIVAGDPARKGFRARLAGLRTACGTALAPGVRAEIGGILDRLDLVRAGLEAVEAEKSAALEAARKAEGDPGGAAAGGPVTEGVRRTRRAAAALVGLRGIGANDALPLGAGLSCRDFRNRRGPAGMAGLAPVPWPGGGVDHDQGTARRAARCCAGTWCRWPGAGCATSRRARCPPGSGAT